MTILREKQNPIFILNIIKALEFNSMMSKPETCTIRAAARGQKNPQNYFQEKSIFMSSRRYLCIVYVKLRVKKQNSTDRIIIVKRKLNFIISTTKNYFKLNLIKLGFLLTIIICGWNFVF